MSDGVVADTGQTLQPFSAEFQTSAACDEAPHQLSGAPAAIAGEVNATVRYRTTKPSTTFVRFGVDGGALDCLGLPCPVVGAAARTPDNGTFVHSVLLEGLTVNTTYRAIVSAEDDFGLVATGTLTFLTEPLPKIAVNEVMVDPSGTENQGEYIELANFGAVEIDVTGWRVEVTGSSTCTATLPARIIPPGAFLLVVGNAFVPGTYGLADDNTLARSSSQSVCGSGLVNAGVQVVVMEPSGRPVSSLGKHITLASRDEGRSIERIAPDAPDVAASFCLSRTDSGPSPARQNGIVAQGCQ